MTQLLTLQRYEDLKVRDVKTLTELSKVAPIRAVFDGDKCVVVVLKEDF